MKRLLALLLVAAIGCSGDSSSARVGPDGTKKPRVCKVIAIIGEKPWTQWVLLSDTENYQRNWMSVEDFMEKSQHGWGSPPLPGKIIYEFDEAAESMRRVMMDEQTRKTLKLDKK